MFMNDSQKQLSLPRFDFDPCLLRFEFDARGSRFAEPLQSFPKCLLAYETITKDIGKGLRFIVLKLNSTLQLTTIEFGLKNFAAEQQFPPVCADNFNKLAHRPLSPTNTPFNQASNSKFDSKREQYFR